MHEITREKSELGFVGVGYMGRPIAQRLLDVLSETAGGAPAHLGKLARARKRDYSPQFPLRLMNKDFGLILKLAAAVGAHMPAARAAYEVNAKQSEQRIEQDLSAVILQMEK